MSKTLHLVLKSKWYDKIASGEKTSEYRECKPYWNKRFVGYDFDTTYAYGYCKIFKQRCLSVKQKDCEKSELKNLELLVNNVFK